VRVVVADDESDVVLLCRMALERRGHEVTAFGDGASALEAILAGSGDLILLDVMLPVLDGHGVLRGLADAGNDTPVVMMSALVREGDQRRGLEGGATEYLTKPFTVETLVKVVEDLAAMTAAQRGVYRLNALDSLGRSHTPRVPRLGGDLPSAGTGQLASIDASISGLLDLAVDAIVTVDVDQRIVGFNKGGEALFGYFSEELLGKPLDILLPTYAVDAHRKHVADFASGAATARLMGQRQEIFGRRKDGVLFPAEASIVKLEVGGRPLFAAILRDASDRRKAEAQLLSRARQQAAVARLGQQALSGTDARTLMHDVVRELADTLGVEFADVMELQSDGDLLLRAGVGWDPAQIGTVRVDGGRRSHGGFTLTSNEPTLVDNLATETRFVPSDLLRSHNVVSGMAVTITGPSRPFGTLGVHSTEARRFETDDIHFLQSVSNVLAAAIERERTADRQRAFLEAAPDATFVVNSEGRIVSVNAQAEALFGYGRDELVGRKVESLVPERVRDTHALHRADYSNARRARPMGAGLELFGLRKDGTEVPVDIMLSPVDTEDGQLVVAAVRDVTERRRVEAVRDSFLHAVSHELRTPLTSVIGFASILADEGGVPVTHEQRVDMTRRLLVNAEKLDQLLSDLLDLDRLARGIVEPQRRLTDLGNLARLVVSHLPPHDHPIEIDVQPESLVVAVDPAQTERIIENLVVNAIRHSGAGTPIWVRAARSPNGVLITVDDAGTGVPAPMRDAIFEPFRRLESASASPGTGVGLSLVARFAELHGGRAWVEDRAGGGASFRVLLSEPESVPVASG
jgi:PAS domain S-box-containing protein